MHIYTPSRRSGGASTRSRVPDICNEGGIPDVLVLEVGVEQDMMPYDG